MASKLREGGQQGAGCGLAGLLVSGKIAKRRTQLLALPVLVKWLPSLYLEWLTLSQQWDATSNTFPSGSA